jgi:DNA repair ATPase RecN
MNSLKRMILDAMLPAFKSANTELLKAIKMNDKSDAVPYADLEAINKAMKSNDGEKVGTELKKVQLKFKDSEKKLNEDLKDVTQRFSEAQKEIDSYKEKTKQLKAIKQLFDKAKKLVSGLNTSPKSASMLAAITDKLKQYGDLSGKAQKVIQIVSSGKDASKQIDVLAKAVLSAEKKFTKESSSFEKESKKSSDSYIVLKERLKICKEKLAAFQKERLFIANVVKMMPQGDLRQKNGAVDYKAMANKLYDEFLKVKQSAQNDVPKIIDIYYKNKIDYEEYTKRIKRLVWNAYESIPSEFSKAALIVKSAYKFNTFSDEKKLLSELAKARDEIKKAGGDYKQYLSPIIDYLKQVESKNNNQPYPDGITKNDASMISFYAEKGEMDDATRYVLENIGQFKNKVEKIESEYSKIRELALKEKVKLPRSIWIFDMFHSQGL